MDHAREREESSEKRNEGQEGEEEGRKMIKHE